MSFWIIVGLVLWIVLGALVSDDKEKAKVIRHNQQMSDCMKAGHERLWCEGLLK